MLHIKCPYCGTRSQNEFAYGGDATVKRPELNKEVSDKGEMVMGGDLDGYNSYAQRGNLPTLQHVLTEGIAMLPFLSKLKMLRTWGGIMDMSMDGSPIIDKTHIDGLYLNCGWCYGGFKATPASGWTFAHTIAQDRPHDLNAGFSLNRFNTGNLIDEKGLGTKTWIS